MTKVTKTASKATKTASKATKTASKATKNNTIALLENGKVYGNIVNAQEISLHRINELSKATIDGMSYTLQIGDFETDLKKFSSRAKKYIKFLSATTVPENLDVVDLVDLNEKIRKDAEKTLMRAYTFSPNEIKSISAMSQTKFLESLKSRKHIGTAINQIAELLNIEPKNLLTNGKK